MPLDERTPNLVSELKSVTYDSILAKNGKKLAKYPIISVFDRFLAKNGVKGYPISIMRPDSESYHQDAYVRHKKERD